MAKNPYDLNYYGQDTKVTGYGGLPSLPNSSAAAPAWNVGPGQTSDNPFDYPTDPNATPMGQRNALPGISIADAANINNWLAGLGFNQFSPLIPQTSAALQGALQGQLPPGITEFLDNLQNLQNAKLSADINSQLPRTQQQIDDTTQGGVKAQGHIDAANAAIAARAKGMSDIALQRNQAQINELNPFLSAAIQQGIGLIPQTESAYNQMAAVRAMQAQAEAAKKSAKSSGGIFGK